MHGEHSSSTRPKLTLAFAHLAIVLWVAWVGPCPVSPVRAAGQDDIWRPMHLLVGEWVGTASGFGGTSDVEHTWTFVLGDRFLELRTRSVTRNEGEARDVHEDVGFLSRDTDRGVFVFRQFLSEGFVNTYDVSVDADSLPSFLFEYREAESAAGTRARMELRFIAADEYDMVLDLAAPGKDFVSCQRMHMKKAEAR
jgi:hypothetical protein